LDFFNRSRGGRGVVEDDEGLAFGFEVGLCDEVDDVAVFGEDFAERGLEFVDLYFFFEVPDIDSIWKKCLAVRISHAWKENLRRTGRVCS
jgi:hypothetical protein